MRRAIVCALLGACVGGEARLQDEPIGECAANETACGAACVNTTLDPNNCGACDHPCGAGQLCSIGMCGSECLGGTLQCGDRCVDPTIDSLHCGSCEVACAANEICVQSMCGIGCGDGLIDCTGDCVDITSSAEHCGGCDKPCKTGEVCASGKCYAESCFDLLSNDPSLADGQYFIDPDGSAGEPPFEVACNMSTDGGGWIQLSIDDSQQVLMAQQSAGNPWNKCADDASKHFDWLTQSAVTADFTGDGEHVVALHYQNPLSMVVYTDAQVQALRGVIEELSTTTRMVALTADDDNGDWQTTMMSGHEVYIKGASLSLTLLTPGEDGDCGGSSNWPLPGSASGYYLWHSTAAASDAEGSTVNSLPGLGIGDLLPVEVELVVHSGGGVAFGWEKAIFLVR